MMWLDFILVLNFVFLGFQLIIIYYHTQKRTENKIKTKDKF